MPAPTLDGSATGTSTTVATVSATLTTTGTNRIVCALVYIELGSGDRWITGITGGGLTWAKRTQITIFPDSANDNAQSLELWWAVAPSALTAVTITATANTAFDDSAMLVFGVAGCNTTSPWDANPSLAARGNNYNATAPSFSNISTTQANDFLIFGYGSNTSQTIGTVPAGFTAINSVINSGGSKFASVGAASRGVTAAQTSQTYTWGSTMIGSGNVALFDVLTADTGGSTTAPLPNYETLARKSVTTTNTAALHTAGISANNVIVILSYCEQTGGGPAITGISGGGLTWTLRSRSHASARGSMEVWYAQITGTLAATTVTVTYAANFDNLSLVVLSVVGCSSAIWDANVSVPATQSNTAGGSWTPSVSVSTTQASDMVLALAGVTATTATTTMPSGFAFLDRVRDAISGSQRCSLDIGIQGRNTTQTSAAIAWGAALSDGANPNAGGEYLVDALTAGGGAVVVGSAQARALVLA